MSYKYNRRDKNHDAVVNELLAAGWQVIQVYTLKGDNRRADDGLFDSCGDMIAIKHGYKPGRFCTVWIEAKAGAKGIADLTEAEKEFYGFFHGHIIIANERNNAVELCEKFRELY